MIQRFFVQLALTATFIITALTSAFYFGLSSIAAPITVNAPPATMKILLVPLDSRPPCTDYVKSIAGMAGLNILTPPREILDDYRKPGNIAAIHDWALQNISQADAAIISTDMLIHGGLLASRQTVAANGEIETALRLLQELHEKQPTAKIYAFSIIPRLFIADNPATEKFKQPMAEWSALQDKTALFENPADIAKLQKLEVEIPSDIRERYHNLYRINSLLNRQLAGLVRNGVLSGLVVGQDDSTPFGLGNLERRRIENETANEPTLRKKVFVTRGTDEVALTLLGQVLATEGAPEQKVYVHYTEDRTAETIMPYMPFPLSRTVAEKMDLAAINAVDSPSAADFILVVHAGSAQSQAKNLSAQANLLKKWMQAGFPVAVIDLSKDFRSDQTLLPYLRQNNTPVYDLLAYAGWNTASNSTGAAITQAALVLRGRARTEPNATIARESLRVGFIAARMLDDWYYQKVYRPKLNAALQLSGIDPYALHQSREAVTKKISHQMYNAYLDLIYWDWRNAVLTIPSTDYSRMAVAGWKLRVGLPWDRTFEIFVEADMKPAKIITR